MYDSSFKMADNNKIDKLEMESILIFKRVAKILNSEQVQQLKKGFEASLSLVTNCEVNSLHPFWKKEQSRVVTRLNRDQKKLAELLEKRYCNTSSDLTLLSHLLKKIWHLNDDLGRRIQRWNRMRKAYPALGSRMLSDIRCQWKLFWLELNRLAVFVQLKT
ncbi:MAG: hypothetical protein H6562_14995 [Lewinellaceae bacterium]|nr:hypothetical protein [Lewinella sp.]MCB9280197.1 hypothetical protein [Lewinellaceae bacterium]